MHNLATSIAVEIRQSDRERAVARPPGRARRGDTLSERQVVSWDLIEPGPKATAVWLDSGLTKLSGLIRLPEDWDSYGAPPIDAEVAGTLWEVLVTLAEAEAPEPDVVPLSSGGLQLEWYTPELEVQLSIEPPAPQALWLSYRDERSAEKFWEGPLGDAWQLFDDFLSRLARKA